MKSLSWTLVALLLGSGCEGGTNLVGDSGDVPADAADHATDTLLDARDAESEANDVEGDIDECEADVCVPVCAGGCGGDDGCGGRCACREGEVCVVARGECVTARGWVEVPERAVPAVPYGRMVYATARHVMVLVGQDARTGEMRTWEYDGATWTDVITPTAPSSRTNFAIAYDSTRGVVVLFGGNTSLGGFPADTWEYDGSTWTEVSTPGSPPGWNSGPMAYDSAREVLVAFGGCTSGSRTGTCTWEYDGTTWTEVLPPTSPPPDAAGLWNMDYDPVRRVMVLFGYPYHYPDPTTPQTWEYDGTTWRQVFPATSPLPPGSGLRYLMYDPGRRAIICLVHTLGGAPLLETWEYDGTAWAEVDTTTAPPDGSASGYQGVAFDTARDVLVVLSSSVTWEYDGAAWTQVATATWPPAVAEPSIAYDSVRHVTGLSNSAYEFWEYGDAGWRDILTPSLSSMVSPAMVCDETRDVMVVFAGCNVSTGFPPHTSLTSLTLEFDGSSWATVEPPTAPIARTDHAMAYDSLRGVAVMFGGGDADGLFGDTWEYRDGNWTETTPISSPNARSQHALAYDSSRGVVVLFGGTTGTAGLADTWEYDGTYWTETTPAGSPPARSGHALAYDSARGVVVLFGGSTGSASVSDTWEYNGTTWMEIAAPMSPDGRAEHAMAYDAARGAVVLFGGTSSDGSTLADTWEYYGP